jgi:hypothetical protein
VLNSGHWAGWAGAAERCVEGIVTRFEYALWLDSRLVLWTWRRLMEKTEVIWE